MNRGPQSMEDILAEARKNLEQLEACFNVPVLLGVSDEGFVDGPTAVTAPGAPPPLVEPPSGHGTFVVGLQPRNGDGAPDKISFGRSTNCDVVMPFAPVSKQHGYFALIGSTWHVIDTGSTNGTVMDGRTAEKQVALPMTDGTVLQFGAVKVRFLTAKRFVAALRERLGIKL